MLPIGGYIVHLKKNVERPVIAHISTYLPRKCGIGFYTKQLLDSMGSSRFNHLIVAVDDAKPRYQYDNPVRFVINASVPSDYVDAAEFLNKSQTSVVSLQHEYGIFGGDLGRYVLDFSSSLKKPLVTTFHTVLRNPSRPARMILSELASRSSYVVVTLRKAAQLIADVYGVLKSKVRVIQHGAPLATERDPSVEKKQLCLSGRLILSTAGFLSPAKGIQYGIRAVKTLGKKYPNIIYIVVGETHPSIRSHEGEAYRKRLRDLTSDLGLAQQVMFINRFVSEEELAKFLRVADVYVAPYLGRDQVSSGTLTRAIAYGKPIVATPTLFAKETLALERGLFCKFEDAKSIARQVDRILSDPTLKRRLEVRAKRYGKRVGWQQAADNYAKLFNKVVEVQTIHRLYEL